MHVSVRRSVWAVLLCGCLLAWPACDGDDDGGNPVCGNGSLETGEECDDGNVVSGDGCSATCTSEGGAVCGNDILETGEECDDGNTVDGDGCSANCTSEGSPECGNDVLETGEECDDGNTADGDGCSANCTIEGGDTYSVSGTAGRTTGTCPDAIGTIGNLCISIRTDCNDIGTEVAGANVANADFNSPIGFATLVDWTVPDVPNGTYQVHVFVNYDGGVCDEALGTGDLTEGTLCQEVTVNGADVTDMAFEFTSIAP